MKRGLNIIFLIIVVIFCYVYRDTIKNIWVQSINRYFPCRVPISYSIVNFDNRFNITKQDFLNAIKDAEEVWESGYGRNLFNHSENGNLEINLVYDKRQETTDKLQTLGDSLDNDRVEYNTLKSKYNLLIRKYYEDKKIFEEAVRNFEIRKSSYESEVSRLNKKGGASREAYDRLTKESGYLSAESIHLSQMQANLNLLVQDVNNTARDLNEIAQKLNLNVSKYNTIGGSLGEEFEEGVFISDSDGQRINIFQFENRVKLVRVLAHELGHALLLEHNDDPKAIMYRLNNGYNEKLTSTDLTELKNLCGENN